MCITKGFLQLFKLLYVVYRLSVSTQPLKIPLKSNIHLIVFSAAYSFIVEVMLQGRTSQQLFQCEKCHCVEQANQNVNIFGIYQSLDGSLCFSTRKLH